MSGINIKVILLGKNKSFVLKALEFLNEQGITINAVIYEPDEKSSKYNLMALAKKLGIPYMTNDDLYKILADEDNSEVEIFSDIDLVISYLFPKKIEMQLIELPRIGCINFHPAPLPDFRGVSPYSFGILEDFPFWGVSAHFIDEKFDTGDIIKVNKFDVNLKNETSFSLERKSQMHLFELFREIIGMILKDKELPRIKQDKGRYFSKNDFEKLRRINVDDSLEIINKKIRAFWYPSFPGAYIEIQGEKFTVINDTILKIIVNQDI